MSKGQESDFVEFSFSKFLIPAAIVIAGGLIALAVYSGGGEKGSQGEEVVKGAEESVFDDPNITAAGVKIDVNEGAYLGDLDGAKYAIVEFSDYRCPYCQKHAEDTLPEIKSKFVESNEIVYFFREVDTMGPQSTVLSALGQCVFENLGIEEYGKYRVQAYDAQFTENSELLSVMGITDADVKACFEAETYVDRISKNSLLSQSAGVQGVPGFVLGKISEDGVVEGFLIPGAYPFGMFEEVLDFLKN